jgi:hypothetical protein
MPVTYKIYPAERLIRTRCFGDVTPQEVADHFQELARDPNRPDRLNVLLDLTDETSLPETYQLRVVSGQIKELLRIIRFEALAIVASSWALFGMMRVFAVLAEDYFSAIRVFRTTAEAEAWLASHALKSNPASAA